MSYVNDVDAGEYAFDVSSIPKISRAQAAHEVAREFPHSRLAFYILTLYVGPSSLDTISAPVSTMADTVAKPLPTAAETQSAYAEQLAAVPELASYGPVLNSSAKPTPLTESETEYLVTCVKHLFKEHVVFQVRGHSRPL